MNVIFGGINVSVPEDASILTLQSGPPYFRFTDEEFEQFALLISERHHRIDSAGSPGRQITGQ
jgi:hypothetical protein